MTAFNEASTSETVPVMITVPENRSTNPILAPEAFIQISAAIIAVSEGHKVIMPIAFAAYSTLGSSPSFR